MGFSGKNQDPTAYFGQFLNVGDQILPFCGYFEQETIFFIISANYQDTTKGSPRRIDAQTRSSSLSGVKWSNRDLTLQGWHSCSPDPVLVIWSRYRKLGELMPRPGGLLSVVSSDRIVTSHYKGDTAVAQTRCSLFDPYIRNEENWCQTRRSSQ